ncbi:hypothetical protein MD484_g6327, partial [Candolleomyces efflorescens]
MYELVADQEETGLDASIPRIPLHEESTSTQGQGPEIDTLNISDIRSQVSEHLNMNRLVDARARGIDYPTLTIQLEVMKIATRPHPTNAGHTPYAPPLEIYSASVGGGNGGSRARPPGDPLAQNPPNYQIQATQSHGGGVGHAPGFYPPTSHGTHYPPTAVHQSTSGGLMGPIPAPGVSAPIIPNIMQHSISGTNHDALQVAIQEYLRALPLNPHWCASRCSGRKKAVCIGINYIGQRNPLKGCANDARGVRDFLIQRYGFHPQNVLLLTDDDRRNTLPTRREMFNAFMWLVQGAQKDDSLFFHYSGHGGQSEDASGRESDGMDETIFPVDHANAGDIIDDELYQALVAPLPPGCRLTSQLQVLSFRNGPRRARARGVGPGGDVICFSACKDDETAADTFKGGVAVGAMSHALIRTLKESTNQTYEELLSHLRDILIPKYDQKAQISSSHPLNLNEKFTI